MSVLTGRKIFWRWAIPVLSVSAVSGTPGTSRFTETASQAILFHTFSPFHHIYAHLLSQDSYRGSLSYPGRSRQEQNALLLSPDSLSIQDSSPCISSDGPCSPGSFRPGELCSPLDIRIKPHGASFSLWLFSAFQVPIRPKGQLPDIDLAGTDLGRRTVYVRPHAILRL